MNFFLFLCLITSFIETASSQCTTLIFPQPGHVSITSNQSINATDNVYWICSGLNVTILSSPGAAFLCESNVTLNILGSSGDQVFAKSGCVINNNSSTSIGVVCDPSNVTLNNTGSGTLVIDAACNPVIYDYSLLGGPGNCELVSSIGENELKSVSVFPNPFNNSFYIKGIINGGNAILYNVFGEDVQNWKVSPNDNKIETDSLTQGVYFLEVKTSDGNALMKIIKQ